MGVVTGGGGGGAAFNGGTITKALEVDPVSNAVEPLIGARAPAGFDANTSGLLIQIAGEDGFSAVAADDSSLRLVAGTGRGNELLLMTAFDHPSRAVALGTGFGIAVTADAGMVEVDSEAGVRQFHASAALGIITTTHAAPADGDLNAGECALWFDQTNGAAKLMVKAKTANATVVAAAIALA